ncbi:Importin subunit alpha-1a-like protein [Drosera capensis]
MLSRRRQTDRVLLVIRRLIGSSDDELKSVACWALCYITHKSKENIERVIIMRICPQLVQLLGHPTLYVLNPALLAVNMMCYGDDFHLQEIIFLEVPWNLGEMTYCSCS